MPFTRRWIQTTQTTLVLSHEHLISDIPDNTGLITYTFDFIKTALSRTAVMSLQIIAVSDEIETNGVYFSYVDIYTISQEGILPKYYIMFYFFVI